MSREIDERIVAMRFDNQEFERHAQTTMNTIEKLKGAFDMQGTSDSFNVLQEALNHLDISTFLRNSLGAIERFRLINQAIDQTINKVKTAVKAMSVDQFSAGWDKYEKKTESVQTIMAATAKDFTDTAEQMQYVNDQLGKLNWFTDETSYNFTDMTSNIGKFTSVGVKLDDAVTAMEGIATWAGISGAKIPEASRAMYNLSQAMGTGAVKLIDWRSIENANMATREFKENVIDVALELGTLKKAADGTIYSADNLTHVVSATNFNENLKDEWFSADVLTTVLKRYGSFTDKMHEYITRIEDETGHYVTTSTFMGWAQDYADTAKDSSKVLQKAMDETGMSADSLKEMFNELNKSEYELGKRSFKAAQEAKTWSDAFDSVKDAVSTGWMNTFETIFGDYEQSKVLWTNVANELYDVFASGGELRNSILEAWAEMLDETDHTGRDLLLGSFGNIWRGFTGLLFAAKDALHSVFIGYSDDGHIIDTVATKLMNFSKWLNKTTSALDFSDETLVKIRYAMESILRPIKFVADATFTLLSSLSPLWGSFKYAIKSIFPALIGLLSEFGGTFGDTFDGSFFEEVANKLRKVFDVVAKILDRVTRAITKTLQIIRKAIYDSAVKYADVFNKGGKHLEASIKGIVKFLTSMITSIGDVISEVTGIEWVSKRFRDLAYIVELVNDNVIQLEKDFVKWYRSFGGGANGLIRATGHVLRSAITNITKWLSKVTGIQWFEQFGISADKSILHVHDKLINFMKETRAMYQYFGGGLGATLKTAANQTGSVILSLFNWLSEKTGNTWFRSFGLKVYNFFAGLKDPIDKFVTKLEAALEKIKEFFAPVIEVFNNAFGWIWAKDEPKHYKDPLAAVADTAEDAAKRIDVAYKSASQLALEIIRGDWGNGAERDQRLLEAGYNNDLVQNNVVNKIWSIYGTWIDGYEAVLAEYEKVDARLDGSPLPADEKKIDRGISSYKKAYAVLDDGTEYVKGASESIRTVSQQLEDAKQTVLEGLPELIMSIGASVAKAKIFIDETIASVVDFIEREQVIDKIMAGAISFKDIIVSVFKSVTGFFTTHGPEIKIFLLNVISGIVSLAVTAKNAVTSIIGFFRKMFYGTAPLFNNLVSNVLVGNWADAWQSIKDIFTKVTSNLRLQYLDFASKLSKIHNPFVELFKASIIIFNLLKTVVKGVIGLFTGASVEGDGFAFGIVGVIGKVVDAIKNKIAAISNSFKKIFAGTKETFEKLQFNLLISNWAGAASYIKLFFKQIRSNIRVAYPTFSKLIDSLESIYTAAAGIIQDIFGFVINHKDEILTFAGDVLGVIKRVVSSARIIGSKVFLSIMDYLGTSAPNIRELGKSLGGKVWNGVVATWQNVLKVFDGTGPIFRRLIKWLEMGNWDSAGKAMLKLFDQIRTNVSSMWDEFVTDMSQKSPAFAKVASTTGAIRDKLVSVFASIFDFFERHAPEFKIFGISIWESLKSGWETFQNGLSTITDWIKTNISPTFDELITAILTFDWDTAKTIISGYFDVLGPAIVQGFTNVINFVRDRIKDISIFGINIYDFLSSVFGQTFGTSETNSAENKLEDTAEEVSSNLENTVFHALAPVFSGPGEIGTTITTMMSEYQESGKFDPNALGTIFKIVGGMLTAGFSVFKNFQFGRLALSLIKGSRSIAKGLESFPTIMTDIGNLLSMDNIKSIIKLKNRKKWSETILDLALSFIIVVGAIYLLGRMDADMLSQGLDAAMKIAIGMAIFIAIVKTFEAIAGRGKDQVEGAGATLSGIGKAILRIAVSIGILLAAVYLFGIMPTDILKQGIAVVSLLMFEMFILLALLAAVAKAGKKGKGVNVAFKGIGTTMLGIAASILLMVVAVKKFGNMPMKQLAQGIGAVSILLAEMLILMAILALCAKGKNGSGLSLKGAAVILSIALAVILLMAPVRELGAMPLEQMLQGVIGVGAIMLELAATLAIISYASTKATAGTIVKALFMIAEILGAVVVVLWAMQEFPPNIDLEQAKAIALLLGVMMGGEGIITLIAGLDNKVVSVKWGAIFKALFMLAEAVGFLYGVLRVLEEHPINVDKDQVETFNELLGALYVFIGELAVINMAENAIFKSSKGFGHQLGTAVASLGSEAGVLAETLAAIEILMVIMDSHSIDTTKWDEGKIQLLGKMLHEVGIFVGELALINLAENAILSKINSKSKSKKVNAKNWSEVGMDLVYQLGSIVEVVGAIWLVIAMMNNIDPPSDNWTNKSIKTLGRMLLCVAAFFGEMSLIKLAGDSLLNKETTRSAGTSMETISNNSNSWSHMLQSLVYQGGTLVEISGLIALAMVMLNSIDPPKMTWTKGRIEVLERLLVAVGVFYTAMAGIDIIANKLLDEGSTSKTTRNVTEITENSQGWSNMFQSLVYQGGTLIELAGIVALAMTMLNSIDPPKSSWNETNIGVLERLLVAIGVFYTAMAGIDVIANKILDNGKSSAAADGVTSVETNSKGWSNMFQSLVYQGGTLIELSGLVALAMVMLNELDPPKDSWNETNIGVLKQLLLAIGEFYTAMAAIDAISGMLTGSGKTSSVENGMTTIETSSTGWSNMFQSLVYQAGTLIELSGIVALAMLMLSELDPPKDTWNEDNIGVLKQLLLAIGEFYAAMAGIEEIGKLMSKRGKSITNVLGSGKTITENSTGWTNVFQDLVYQLGTLGELVGLAAAAMWILSTMDPPKEGWDETKIDLVIKLLDGMADVYLKVAGMMTAKTGIGSILGKLTGTNNNPFNSIQGGGDWLTMLKDLAYQLGSLAEIAGLAAVVMLELEHFKINDTWTDTKIGLVVKLMEGIATVATAFAGAAALIPPAALLKGSFFGALGIDVFAATIFAALETFASIDTALYLINPNLSLGSFIRRICDPLGKIAEQLAGAAEKFVGACTKANDVDPEKLKAVTGCLEVFRDLYNDTEWWDWLVTELFGVENSKWGAVAGGIELLGTTMSTLGTNLKDVDVLKIWAIVPLFDAIRDAMLIESYQSVNTNVQPMVEKLTSLMTALSEVDVNALSDTSDLFTKIGELLTTATNTDLGDSPSEAFLDALYEFISQGLGGLSAAFTNTKDTTLVATYHSIMLGIVEGLTAEIAEGSELEGTTKTAFEGLAKSGLTGFSNALKDGTEFQNLVLPGLYNDPTSFCKAMLQYLEGDSGYLSDDIRGGFKTLAGDGLSAFSNYFKSTLADPKYESAVGNFLIEALTALDNRKIEVYNAFLGVAASALRSYASYFLTEDAFRKYSDAALWFRVHSYGPLYEAGAYVASGLSNGMSSRLPQIVSTATQMATLVKNTVNRVLDIRSPSRVMAQSGVYTVLGYVNAMNDNAYLVQNTVKDIFDMASFMVEDSGNPVITPVVDMSNVVRDAGYINSMFSDGYIIAEANIQAARAAQVGVTRYSDDKVAIPVNYSDAITGIREDISNLSAAISQMRIVMDSGALVGQISAPMDKALGRRYVHQQRRNQY